MCFSCAEVRPYDLWGRKGEGGGVRVIESGGSGGTVMPMRGEFHCVSGTQARCCLRQGERKNDICRYNFSVLTRNVPAKVDTVVAMCVCFDCYV